MISLIGSSVRVSPSRGGIISQRIVIRNLLQDVVSLIRHIVRVVFLGRSSRYTGREIQIRLGTSRPDRDDDNKRTETAAPRETNNE